jgi:hypothetical protein
VSSSDIFTAPGSTGCQTPKRSPQGITGIAKSLGIVTYISEAAIVLAICSKERLCSVRRAREGTDRALARIKTHTG